MNYAAFFSFILMSSFTPGPNNIISVSNAGKYGFKRALHYSTGVFFGVIIIVSICAAFSSALLHLLPSIEPFMRGFGAVYMLWLAWTIWRNKPHDAKKRSLRTDTVFSGIILQFVNVKCYIYGLTAMGMVLPHYSSLFPVGVFIVLMGAVSFSATALWAFGGAALDSFLKKHEKLVNAVLALMLVYCAVSILLD